MEKARIGDVTQIHTMINRFAARGDMLPRPMSEIYESLRDFFVVREDGQVIACASLHIYWEDLAEVRSVAVIEERQESGLGRELVNACVDEAKALGISTIFTLTAKPEFFERIGFRRTDMMELPRKVWGECYRCPKFPNCDEVALIYKSEGDAP